MINHTLRKTSLLLILATTYITTYADKVSDIDKFLNSYPSTNQIKSGLLQHKFSCQDLVNGYINRVKLYNLTTANGMAPLNAITQINPQAIVEAQNIDDNLPQNSSKKLLCVPVIVKDNIDVLGLRSSSGSLSLLGVYPISDSAIIRNIKAKGGIILAKSSMNELAAGLDGISGLSGRIGNAYNPSYSPGGSSGGSAVSVAAGFAPLAIGTDNSGSVRIPAAYNGIYALRPTYGLISQAGILPAGNLDGTAGPMANNVIDLAKLLTVMSKSNTDYSQNLNAKSLAGRHFAIVKNVAGKNLWDGMPKDIVNIYDLVKSNLQKEGATITEINLPDYKLDRKNNIAGTIDDINNYLEYNISSTSNFNEFCNGNTRVFGNKGKCLKFLSGIPAKNSQAYKNVITLIKQNQEYLLTLMQHHKLEGLILPSGKHGIANYNISDIGDQSIISSNSGLPEVTIPVAQYKGLPVSLEILGPKYAESALLNYAFAYQTHHYRFMAPKLNQDNQFNSWSINNLNMLYLLIGKISFDIAIKPANKNAITPLQSYKATQKAIYMLNTSKHSLAK